MEQSFAPDAGVMKPHAEDGIHVEIGQDEILFELPSPGDQSSCLIEDEASSVKNEFVLAAHQVTVGDDG
jgi:hypothetical protein